MTLTVVADFEVPLESLQSAPATDAAFSVNEEAVGMLSSMGFTRDQAIKALKATVLSLVSKGRPPVLAVRALCRIKLLPVTHVLVDMWMLTAKPVHKL